MLVCLDESLSVATTFKVVIERRICYSTDDFFTAAAVMFAAYYVFNLEYAADTSATLEFIQR